MNILRRTMSRVKKVMPKKKTTYNKLVQATPGGTMFQKRNKEVEEALRNI